MELQIWSSVTAVWAGMFVVICTIIILGREKRKIWRNGTGGMRMERAVMQGQNKEEMKKELKDNKSEMEEVDREWENVIGNNNVVRQEEMMTKAEAPVCIKGNNENAIDARERGVTVKVERMTQWNEPVFSEWVGTNEDWRNESEVRNIKNEQGSEENEVK